MKHLTATALAAATTLTLGLQVAQAESQLGAFDPAAHPAPPQTVEPGPVQTPQIADNRLRGGRLSPADLHLGDTDHSATAEQPVVTHDYAKETLFGKLSPVSSNRKG